MGNNFVPEMFVWEYQRFIALNDVDKESAVQQDLTNVVDLKLCSWCISPERKEKRKERKSQTIQCFEQFQKPATDSA